MKPTFSMLFLICIFLQDGYGEDKPLVIPFVPKPVMGMRFSDLNYVKESVITEEGEQLVRISQSVTLLMRIEVTTKGNGDLISIYKSQKDRVVQIVDQHDNGALYVDGMLNYCFVDMDGDNVLDLVVSGVKQIKEDGSEKVVANICIYEVYKYNRESMQWMKVASE